MTKNQKTSKENQIPKSQTSKPFYQFRADANIHNPSDTHLSRRDNKHLKQTE